MSRVRTVVRWGLWLTIGLLLTFRGGTTVSTSDGTLLVHPAVFSAAVLVWLFITVAIVRRRWRKIR